MKDSTPPWSELYQHRRKLQEKYPSIYSVPVVKKLRDLLRREVSAEDRLLDFGAGAKKLRGTLGTLLPDIDYFSLDIDDRFDHDFQHARELPDRHFDWIVMSEVIEHLGYAEGMEIIAELFRSLRPGGGLLVTTPNVIHPNRFFGDVTHRTFYRYDDLGACLRMSGFEDIRLYRVYNDPIQRKILKQYIFRFLFRFLEIDFADTVIAVGLRP